LKTLIASESGILGECEGCIITLLIVLLVSFNKDSENISELKETLCFLARKQLGKKNLW
jgi:hypothetical protein